ncbi:MULTISPECIES: DUF3696 domain-containing protein [unclassified Maridesulfovibrio]|uniref:DUF3696 domain-containing protein n=1 Tax=unclassified Maridesulfovibrio TaxID=2794999 RepID=UPI003B3ED208
MINGIYLKNFKSFKNFELNLAPLTVLAGLNSSGKSSVLQALRFFESLRNTGKLNPLPGHGDLQEFINSDVRDKPAIIDFSYKHHENQSVAIKRNKINHANPWLSYFQTYYIGANRLGPSTTLPHSDQTHDIGVGAQGEYVLSYIAQREDLLLPESIRHPTAEGNILEYNIPAWLGEISPGISFKIESQPKIDLDFARYDNFRPANVGFGLSYTLPVIALILGACADKNKANADRISLFHADSPDRTLLLIENPEAHLHPYGQTILGQLLALAVGCGIQIVVETHSDHLMDGVRIAVKDNKIAASDVQFHNFTKNDGYSSVSSPKIFENGKLEFWPEGFGDQSVKNMARLAKRS